MTLSDRSLAWGSLGTLYLVWGTGCPAIKICLDEGFGPFGLGALRLLAAAALLLVLAVGRGRSVDRTELPRILWIGVLFWVVGSGLQVWGQQGVSAGVAALLLGTTPLWGALFTRIAAPTLAGLLLALCGLGVAAEGTLDGPSVVALLLAAIVGAWAGAGAGTLRSDVLWVSALQLGVGGLGQLLAMVATGETLPTVSAGAWTAWTWLVVGPAVVGMLAYVQATRALALPIVLTYAIVNPAVALLFGWGLLAEPLGPRQILGLLLVGVGLVPVVVPRGSLQRLTRRRIPSVA
jgi:drug/metabolite transporter (DMT)-like permease